MSPSNFSSLQCHLLDVFIEDIVLVLVNILQRPQELVNEVSVVYQLSSKDKETELQSCKLEIDKLREVEINCVREIKGYDNNSVKR